MKKFNGVYANAYKTIFGLITIEHTTNGWTFYMQEQSIVRPRSIGVELLMRHFMTLELATSYLYDIDERYTKEVNELLESV